MVLVKPVVFKLFIFFNHFEHYFSALASELGQKVSLCCRSTHTFIGYKLLVRYSVVYDAYTGESP